MDKTKYNITVGGESFVLSLPTNKSNAVAYLAAAKYSNIGAIIAEREDSPESAAMYAQYRAWHALCTDAVKDIDFAPLNKVANEQIEAERIEAEKEAEEERKYYDEHIAPIERLEAAKKAIDAETDEKILTGHIWNDTPIWLSNENQFNFKAAYDIAFQTNGMNLPITFKLGEKDGESIFHTFESIDELQGFYLSCVDWINACLNRGWERKAALIIK